MKYIVEYIWIDAFGALRSKNKVYLNKPESINDITVWNFDGSSTGQAETGNSERFLKPIYMCNNPFFENSYLVLCAVYEDLELTKPGIYNNFNICSEILNKYVDTKPWFGFEQEYFLLKRSKTNISNCPLELENVSECNEQGQYYCSVGAQNAFGRNIVDEHLLNCIKAGISIYGTNAEVAPSQWEFQIGTVEGIEAAHQLWLARYILIRTAEKYDVCVSFHPKLFKELNGSGCHTNFSNKDTRQPGGYEMMIRDIFAKLEKQHDLHIMNYGDYNNLRLTGHHETASYNKFSWGVASRNTSIRVGLDTKVNGYGYFEDRRPASNCDPYLVSMLLVKTINSKLETEVDSSYF